jgi:hypothetical protein
MGGAKGVKLILGKRKAEMKREFRKPEGGVSVRWSADL